MDYFTLVFGNANRRRIHVFADLQPYICTWPQCKDELATFPTRRLWADHEFNEHRVSRAWKCYNCSSVLSSPDDWRQHLEDKHDIIISQRRIQAALKAAEILSPCQIEDQRCPLCRKPLGQTKRAFATHLGRHMEEISLATLPRDADSDLEEESVRSHSTTSSRSLTNKGEPTYMTTNKVSDLDFFHEGCEVMFKSPICESEGELFKVKEDVYQNPRPR